jgi:predicted TIM-barrel fold metal-dependent hydrolase
MPIIDAHIHFADDDPEFLALLDRYDLKLLNICVAEDEFGHWRDQGAHYRRFAEAMPARFAWCTTFDMPRFDDPDYVDKVIAGLDHDFAAGAVACKVWKNIGMECRKPSGEFMMIDDPLLDPIFAHIAKQDRTLLMHIAEPLACWRPLEEDSPHQSYYRENPQWHMYNKPDYPSHARLIAARDHVVEKHPTLRIVGAHIGSLEYDVAEPAKRFDRYPNFAVDISARLGDLAYQDSAKVRQFFLDYSDRLLFGTDEVQMRPLASLSADERARTLEWVRNDYAQHFAYFEQAGPVTVNQRTVQGVGLPADVLEEFYRTDAQRWYPGL